MRRIVIVGTPGAGKTTLARRLAEQLDLTHIELDAIHHLPDWQEADADDFRSDLRVGLERGNRETNGWVIDGNYTSRTNGVHIAAADTVVWLDPSRRAATLRVLRRTIVRSARREELWNGNRERLSSLVKRDPEDNIVLWTWTKHPKYQKQYTDAQTSPEWAHLKVVRLSTFAEVDQFCNSLV